MPPNLPGQRTVFQSTYLYKVRQAFSEGDKPVDMFQSTYLYKVRLRDTVTVIAPVKFQSTYLYKVRPSGGC